MYYNPTYPNNFTWNQPNAYTKQDVVRVNGENGAKAYNMAPNSSVLLLDENEPIVWLKTTDGAGYPTVTGYQITPMMTQAEKDANTIAALEDRINKLERKLNKYGKSNRGNANETATPIAEG